MDEIAHLLKLTAGLFSHEKHHKLEQRMNHTA